VPEICAASFFTAQPAHVLLFKRRCRTAVDFQLTEIRWLDGLLISISTTDNPYAGVD
jgi:hypothetical protein